MRCLIDTNILLRGLDRNHPMCRVVRRALIALRRQDDRLFLAVQNLIEFWAVATRPVDSNGLGMSIQWATAQLGKMKQFFALLPESADTFPEMGAPCRPAPSLWQEDARCAPCGGHELTSHHAHHDFQRRGLRPLS